MNNYTVFKNKQCLLRINSTIIQLQLHNTHTKNSQAQDKPKVGFLGK